MKRIATLLWGFIAVAAIAQTHVNPYVRKDGTFVQGHERSSPDSTRYNNYSTQGNINPYTGQAGTVNPYQQPQPSYTPPPAYQAPQPYRAPTCGVVNGQYVCR